MDKIKELKILAKECLHCQGMPKAYHQNFVGDTFAGDEYMLGMIYCHNKMLNKLHNEGNFYRYI